MLNLRSISADARALRDGEPERWATPAELAGKRVLGAGQYSCIDIASPHCPVPEFLRNHPEYLENHPFDGVAIPVRIPEPWCKDHGLLETGYALHDLVFTAVPLDDAAIAGARQALQSVRWAQCTDNRLWVTVRDGTLSGDNDRRAPLLTDPDWDIACANAALTAKLAKDTGLVGLVVDTEMYTNYATGQLYPFGQFDSATWRRRGQKWIDAVQKAFPSISLLFFFCWGPEHEKGGWPEYENLKPFMDGILDNLRAPASIIHGWESTFWYGGRRRMPGGKMYDYPGDRKTFHDTARMVKGWRSLSADPAKFDRFVKLGMGAWVESDPWNLYPGWPSGVMEELPWSNLPMTLAYSESTVWVFSGHTHYPQTPTQRNPFLWSIANQTRNVKGQPIPTFDERFDSDPTRRGWAFDFDMLDAGRPIQTGFLPVFTTDTLGYAWDSRTRCLQLAGQWPGGSRMQPGHVFQRQRRRFSKAVAPLPARATRSLEITLAVDKPAEDAAFVPSIGFFHHDRYGDDQSVGVRVNGNRDMVLRIGHAGNWAEARLPARSSGKPSGAIRLKLSLRPNAASLELLADSGQSGSRSVTLTFPRGFTTAGLDEVGVAYPDGDRVPARIVNPAQLRIQRLRLT